MRKFIELAYEFEELKEVFPLFNFFPRVSINDSNDTEGIYSYSSNGIVELRKYDPVTDYDPKEVPLDALGNATVRDVTIWEQWDEEKEDYVQSLSIEVDDLGFNDF